MDYETKILLNKFIEFITNPAWWSVIATFVAAYVAARITSKFSKRQTELQEQQLKIQERQNELQEQQIKLQEQQNSIQTHGMRKMIYNFMHDINGLAAIFLTEIRDFLAEYPTEQSQAPLYEILDGISKIAEDFEDKFLDISLHYSIVEAVDCDNIVYSMIDAVEQLRDIINNNGLKDNYTIVEEFWSEDDSVYINAILGCVKDEYADNYRSILEEFVRSKEVLRGLLDSIISKK